MPPNQSRWGCIDVNPRFLADRQFGHPELLKLVEF